MKTLKQWALEFTVDGIYAALFYLWQFKGVEGAGNVLLTFLWLIVALGFCCSFVVGSVPVEKLRYPKSIEVFSALTKLVLFGALAWAGHEVLAALYLFVAFWMRSARKIAIEKAEKAADKRHQDEAACRQAYDNRYHKIRAAVGYDEFRAIWFKAIESLEVYEADLQRLVDIGRLIDEKFTSANDVSIDRIIIKREEVRL